jgi:hypothetical protein
MRRPDPKTAETLFRQMRVMPDEKVSQGGIWGSTFSWGNYRQDRAMSERATISAIYL